jgi:DNA-binding transcriptional regulator YiaG
VAGREIREARKAAGLSQVEMGRRLDIPLRTIQDWEADRRSCPPYVERLVLKELIERTEK